jgi:hypothetical protein
MTPKTRRILPRSKLGLTLSLLYLGLAITIACSERYGGPSSGSFISLPGLATTVITFPAAYLLSSYFPWLSFDQIGFFDTPYAAKTLFAIGLSIAACAALVYLAGAALGALFRYLFGKS